MESESMQSAEIGELAKALALAQADITGAVKTSVNPFYKSRYADLATIMDSCRGPLSKHGLAVIQTTDGTDGASVTILTTLAHGSGQWVRGKLVMRAEKTDPQTIGKCITYARRYALAAIVGVVSEDDDGNSASGKDPHHAQERTPAGLPARVHPPAASTEEMFRTGQAKMAPPVHPPPAAKEIIPDRLQALMADSGVSIYKLRKYLEAKGFIATNAPISTMKPEVYHEMIKPENWEKVVGRINQAA